MLILEVYRNARSEHYISCAFLFVALLHSTRGLWWFTSTTFTTQKCTILNNNNNHHRNIIGFPTDLRSVRTMLNDPFLSFLLHFSLLLLLFTYPHFFETLTFFFQKKTKQKGNFYRMVKLFFFFSQCTFFMTPGHI